MGHQSSKHTVCFKARTDHTYAANLPICSYTSNNTNRIPEGFTRRALPGSSVDVLPFYTNDADQPLLRSRPSNVAAGSRFVDKSHHTYDHDDECQVYFLNDENDAESSQQDTSSTQDYNNYECPSPTKRRRMHSSRIEEHYIKATDIEIQSQLNHRKLEELSSENGGALMTFHSGLQDALLESFSDVIDIHDLDPKDQNEYFSTTNQTTVAPAANTLSTCKYDFREYQQHIYKLTQNQIPFPINLICSINLLQLMNESNISNAQYSNIIKWHERTILSMAALTPNTSDQSTSIHNFLCCLQKDKGKVIKEISDILTKKDESIGLKPIHTAIRAPSGVWHTLSKFPLKGILYSLFANSFLMNSSNSWLFDKYYRNPTLISRETGDARFYGDIHTGTWFLKAYQKICTSNNDVLVPLMLFIDETTIDKNGRQSLDAVLMTIGLFRRKVRNKPEAWRLLGYIPDCSEAVVNEQAPENSEQKRKDYHHYLTNMLQEIYELEKSDGILWQIPKSDGSGINEVVRFRFCLMFVSGDAPGLDKLSDMYASYSISSNFVCRDCNCPTNLLNDPDVMCNFIQREEIIKKSKKDLKKMCFYKIENNAFNRHDFGGDLGGINGCSPPEILHQFLLGVVQTQLNFFSNAITAPAMKYVDKMIKNIASNFHRQSDRSFPNISLFKCGFSKSSLTGKEHIDQLFVLYLALIQSYSLNKLPQLEAQNDNRFITTKKRKVRTMNENATEQTELYIKEKVEYRKIMGDIQSMKDWIKLLEHTLCFNEWIHQENIPFSQLQQGTNEFNQSTDCLATTAIRNYLRKYREIVTEVAGNKTCKAKIHWTLHLPHYARKFGCLLNQNGGIGERMLKSLVKECARKTQRRQHLLAQQACNRYYESNLIQTMHNIINGPKACFLGSSIRNIPKPSNLNDSAAVVQEQNTFARPFQTNNVVSHNEIFSRTRNYSVGGRFQIVFDDDFQTYLHTFWHNGKKDTDTFHSQEFLKSIMVRFRCSDIGITDSTIHAFSVLRFQRDWNVHHSDQEEGDYSPLQETTDDEDDNVVFRADPCFFKRPWFDWCITSWNTGDPPNDQDHLHNDEDDEHLQHVESFPSRIILFIDPNKMKFEDKERVIREKGRLWAIVKSTTKDTRSNSNECNQTSRQQRNRTAPSPNNFCKLVETYKTEEIVRIISVNAIEKDAFVVTDVDTVFTNSNNSYGSSMVFSGKHILLLKNKSEWADEFINGNWLSNTL